MTTPRGPTRWVLGPKQRLCTKQYGGELLVFCQGQMGHHDGQEVFQTLWTKVMSNLDKFDGRNARAWLYRIARNTIHDARRKKKPELNNIAAEGRVDGAASAFGLLHPKRKCNSHVFSAASNGWTPSSNHCYGCEILGGLVQVRLPKVSRLKWERWAASSIAPRKKFANCIEG